jgi:hypothetical protein
VAFIHSYYWMESCPYLGLGCVRLRSCEDARGTRRVPLAKTCSFQLLIETRCCGCLQSFRLLLRMARRLGCVAAEVSRPSWGTASIYRDVRRTTLRLLWGGSCSHNFGTLVVLKILKIYESRSLCYPLNHPRGYGWARVVLPCFGYFPSLHLPSTALLRLLLDAIPPRLGDDSEAFGLCKYLWRALLFQWLLSSFGCPYF